MKINFRPYLTEVFIETGSGGGEGIMAALKAQFKKIHSIELSDACYARCVERFGHRKRRVKLYHGDSRQILPQILSEINERCTFWIDAHYCGWPTAGEGDSIPIMDELKTIAKHHIKNHTILIDDMRLVRDKEGEWKNFPYCTCDIEEFIHSMNPNYKISYVFGEVENDILIAQV